MRAIDCKDLKLPTINVAHPAGNIRGFPIRWIRDWDSIGRKARLALRKLVERAKREPGFVPWPPLANHGRKDIPHDRHRKDHADGPIKEDSELHQHPTSRKFIRQIHRIPPSGCRALAYGWPG